jgi:hypothetical protein
MFGKVIAPRSPQPAWVSDQPELTLIDADHADRRREVARR